MVRGETLMGPSSGSGLVRKVTAAAHSCTTAHRVQRTAFYGTLSRIPGLIFFLPPLLPDSARSDATV